MTFGTLPAGAHGAGTTGHGFLADPRPSQFSSRARAHGGSGRRPIPREGADEGGRMGRHSGSAYEAAPDEWRPEGGGDGGRGRAQPGHPPSGPRHPRASPAPRRPAAAGVAVVANKPDGGLPADGAMPAGAPAKPVGLAAGAAGVSAPTVGPGGGEGVREDRLPATASRRRSQPKALLQRPTMLSLDQDLHWARRITYGITPTALRELKSLGRERYLEQQLTVSARRPGGRRGRRALPADHPDSDPAQAAVRGQRRQARGPAARLPGRRGPARRDEDHQDRLERQPALRADARRLGRRSTTSRSARRPG